MVELPRLWCEACLWMKDANYWDILNSDLFKVVDSLGLMEEEGRGGTWTGPTDHAPALCHLQKTHSRPAPADSEALKMMRCPMPGFTDCGYILSLSKIM